VGRRDYAALAEGGQVYPSLTTPPDITSHNALSPETVLSDDVRVSGCWRVPGSGGQIGVVLSELIYPTHVTIDHIPLPLASDTDDAPREMILWGVIDGAASKDRYAQLHGAVLGAAGVDHQGPHINAGFTFIPISTFEYDRHGKSHVQTFSVHPLVVTSRIDFGLVVLDIVSNWGSNTTCLYRLRVHG
ncbi:hypothetical protein C8Q76DRAFT_571591, partial [Earliella scabrosa]